MVYSIKDTTVLNNGVKMPWLGLGVWKAEDGNEVTSAVKTAIQTGYLSIDTAASYGNEEGVGKGIKESEVPRSNLFITTKIWNTDQGYESTLKAFEESRKKLGLDYLDLYLVHWPVEGKYTETWRAFEKLYGDGFVRAIGVSNFQEHHLLDIFETSKIKPMVDQVELHPLLSQTNLRDFCQKHKIQVEAWSPLMQGHLDVPLLTELAGKYGKSAAQVVLRWDLQNEIVVIPKSVHEARIVENSGVFDFELSDDDMSSINELSRGKRFGPDPDNFHF
jgi:diketogulonate reductase-like aldo/keto reductase